MQLLPLCLLLSVFGWIVGSAVYLCEHPELLVDVITHLLRSFLAYFSYAIPWIQTRAEDIVFTSSSNSTSTSAPLSPPTHPTFWLCGAPLAFLWWARWGGV